MNIEGLAKPSYELALYYKFASNWASGLLPYKDFFPEYPPLSLVFMRLALIFGEKYFTLTFYGLVFLAVVAMIVLVYKLKGNPWMFLATILPIGGLLWDRFDIFPAFLGTLGIFLALKKKPVWAAFVLSLGFMTKIFPIFLTPILLINFWERPKTIIPSILAFVIPIVVVVGSIVNYGGKEGLLKFAEYQGVRGTQIESFRATPLLWNYLKGKVNLVVEYNHATYEIREVK